MFTRNHYSYRVEIFTEFIFQFTKAAAFRFRIRSRPRSTTQRATSSARSTYSRHTSTTARPRSTKINRRKYPTLNRIESQDATTSIPKSTVRSQYVSRIPNPKLTVSKGAIQVDQSLQSTNQQLNERVKIKINEETTELSQIAFSLLQRAPLPSDFKPTLSTISSTTGFHRETSPRIIYISSTLSPIILSTTNRFAIRRPQTFEKTRPVSLGAHQEQEYYYDDDEKGYLGQLPKYAKVILHSNGIIECLDQGNFPHPASCRKFISCATMEKGKVLGWEYTCPKNLSFDPIGGICNWSAGLGCEEK